MLKTYVSYGLPGLFVSEMVSKEVDSRDFENVERYPRAYGFHFYDVEEVMADGGEILKGSAKNYSGWYYWGKKVSQDEVRAQNGECTLLSNMICNGWDYVVETDGGSHFPFYDKDTMLSA